VLKAAKLDPRRQLARPTSQSSDNKIFFSKSAVSLVSFVKVQTNNVIDCASSLHSDLGEAATGATSRRTKPSSTSDRKLRYMKLLGGRKSGNKNDCPLRDQIYRNLHLPERGQQSKIVAGET